VIAHGTLIAAYNIVADASGESREFRELIFVTERFYSEQHNCIMLDIIFYGSPRLPRIRSIEREHGAEFHISHGRWEIIA